jgi:hypothetical protein
MEEAAADFSCTSSFRQPVHLTDGIVRDADGKQTAHSI